MQFNEALAIVLTLAMAHRAIAPVEGNVTEEKMDDAIKMVKDRLDSILVRPKAIKKGKK